jgi:hypothetical protein
VRIVLLVVTLPELHLADWRPTKDTLHRFAGKAFEVGSHTVARWHDGRIVEKNLITTWSPS